MNTNLFKARFQPEQVRGHQLERLRLAILMQPKHPMRPFCMWDGKRLHIGSQSHHRTPSGLLINLIARIKRRLHADELDHLYAEGGL